MALPLLLKAALTSAVSSAVAKIGRADSGKEVAAEVERQLTSNQVLKNELNAERPVQSRVAWGAVIAALGVVVPIAANLLGWDISQDRVVEVGGAIVTLCGAAYVLYGRFKSGLKPLFSPKD